VQAHILVCFLAYVLWMELPGNSKLFRLSGRLRHPDNVQHSDRDTEQRQLR
jgi:hypothetical protein